MITTDPLTWPNHWKRTPASKRIRSRFHRNLRNQDAYNYRNSRGITIGEATTFTMEQLRLMGLCRPDIIISTNLKCRLDGLPYANQKEPPDPGVSVWWRKQTKKGHRVIAIDIYDRAADNLYAIGKTLEAMRGIERWGGGEILERTFTGFTALPAPDGHEVKDDTWAMDVLGATGSETNGELKNLWKAARWRAHPDKGGSVEQFQRVQEAAAVLGLA